MRRADLVTLEFENQNHDKHLNLILVLKLQLQVKGLSQSFRPCQFACRDRSSYQDFPARAEKNQYYE
eukprot:3939089-Rhodomonas_salina.2